MFIVGLDLGKRKSQACIGTPDGAIVVEKRISTTRDALSSLFVEYAPARVLVEASTSAEWVARHLESLGAEVIVGDPRFGPMYAQLDKRIKTDKRDSRALMHALRLTAYQAAHRRQDWARDLRAQLLVRAGLVRSRTRIVVQIRSLVEVRGIPLPSCAVEHLQHKLECAELDDTLRTIIKPLVEQLKTLGEQITALDDQFEEAAAADPVAKRLDGVVGVGPITALAFIVAVEDPARFESARQLASYLGFVPRESSSGEKQRRGRTTKTGDTLARTYLVQAAWRILRSKQEPVLPLRTWAERVAERRGKKVAVTALARRLARILFAMWRDGKDFDASKLPTREH
jgi:transposase